MSIHCDASGGSGCCSNCWSMVCGPQLSRPILKAGKSKCLYCQLTPMATTSTANNVSAVMAKTDNKHIRQKAPKRDVSYA